MKKKIVSGIFLLVFCCLLDSCGARGEKWFLWKDRGNNVSFYLITLFMIHELVLSVVGKTERFYSVENII